MICLLTSRERLVPPLDPDVADLAPADPTLTPYDFEHAVTYVRVLDANAEDADWREVSRIVLHIDPEREPGRARRAFDSHLARAKWAAREGYRQLLHTGGWR
jgi:hypothetical protein